MFKKCLLLLYFTCFCLITAYSLQVTASASNEERAKYKAQSMFAEKLSDLLKDNFKQCLEVTFNLSPVANDLNPPTELISEITLLATHTTIEPSGKSKLFQVELTVPDSIISSHLEKKATTYNKEINSLYNNMERDEHISIYRQIKRLDGFLLSFYFLTPENPFLTDFSKIFKKEISAIKFVALANISILENEVSDHIFPLSLSDNSPDQEHLSINIVLENSKRNISATSEIGQFQRFLQNNLIAGVNKIEVSINIEQLIKHANNRKVISLILEKLLPAKCSFSVTVLQTKKYRISTNIRLDNLEQIQAVLEESGYSLSADVIHPELKITFTAAKEGQAMTSNYYSQGSISLHFLSQKDEVNIVTKELKEFSNQSIQEAREKVISKSLDELEKKLRSVFNKSQ